MKNYELVIEDEIQVSHTRNPYLYKRLPSMRLKILGNTLDGYYALILSKCELPNEVVSLSIQNQKLCNVNENEMTYFENVSIIKAD